MFQPSRTSRSKTALSFLALLLHSGGSAAAQNVTLQLNNVDPLGVADFLPDDGPLGLGLSNGFKGDLSYGLDAKSIYDSNFFLREDNEHSEFTTFISPWLNYRSDPEGGAPFSFVADYTPSARVYAQNTNFNDIDQNVRAVLTVRGSKTMISGYAKYDQIAGTDRLSGDFVDGSIVSYGVDASYQIAPRTTLVGNLSAAMSDYESAALEGADLYTAQIGALWDATGRFSIGPSLRYTLSRSDNTGNQNAGAILVNTRSRAGERTQLIGIAGLEYSRSSRDGQDSSTRFTGALTGAYAITQRLSWSTSINYGTIPSATDVGYNVSNFALTTAFVRELKRGNIETGLIVNLTSYDEVADTISDPETERNISPYAIYRRKFLSDRLAFESVVRYAVNRGDIDWSQLQLSTGIQVQF